MEQKAGRPTESGARANTCRAHPTPCKILVGRGVVVKKLADGGWLKVDKGYGEML